VVRHARRIVVKVGSSLVTAEGRGLDHAALSRWAEQIAALTAQGKEVVLVSSGAIAEGIARLGWKKRPKAVNELQAAAAVGQMGLVQAYESIFRTHGLHAAQVLLTHEDLADRTRYLNARTTLRTLLELRVVPIINENDTVATEEIRVGDNDNLSALAANLIDADTLILLTDQDGLFTADPRSNPGAELVQTVSGDSIPETVWQAAGGTRSGLGTGGMLTKLQAADLARRSGTACIIANGQAVDVLLRLANGERLGTRFEPVTEAVEARKRFILSARRAPGLLTVDEGAAQALRRGGSLLAVGLAAVSGAFRRSDVVRVADAEGRELARGISNYDSRDLARILRKRSDEIESILGYHYGDEVIHRNDLVLL